MVLSVSWARLCAAGASAWRVFDGGFYFFFSHNCCQQSAKYQEKSAALQPSFQQLTCSQVSDSYPLAKGMLRLSAYSSHQHQSPDNSLETPWNQRAQTAHTKQMEEMRCVHVIHDQKPS